MQVGAGAPACEHITESAQASDERRVDRDKREIVVVRAPVEVVSASLVLAKRKSASTPLDEALLAQPHRRHSL